MLSATQCFGVQLSGGPAPDLAVVKPMNRYGQALVVVPHG
jgi:hypothetical protein